MTTLKSYVGQVENGVRTVMVGKDGLIVEELPIHDEVIQLSPSGFDWGFLGAGPAQLAVAILTDMGLSPSFAIAYHQEVKLALISTLPRGRAFIITEEDVLDVLNVPQRASDVFGARS